MGAHFFNPPRYLHLLEVIPTPKTDPAIVKTFSEFAETTLGKGIVVANDVPGFVANRIGVYGIVRAMDHMVKAGLTPVQVDQLTGPALGRASSATFRTADLSGLDIIYHVSNDLGKATPDDEDFTVPFGEARVVRVRSDSSSSSTPAGSRLRRRGSSAMMRSAVSIRLAPGWRPRPAPSRASCATRGPSSPASRDRRRCATA